MPVFQRNGLKFKTVKNITFYILPIHFCKPNVIVCVGFKFKSNKKSLGDFQVEEDLECIFRAKTSSRVEALPSVS
jgi:hypothetical protein